MQVGNLLLLFLRVPDLLIVEVVTRLPVDVRWHQLAVEEWFVPVGGFHTHSVGKQLRVLVSILGAVELLVLLLSDKVWVLVYWLLNIHLVI